MTPKKKMSKEKIKKWLKKHGHNSNEVDSFELSTSDKIHLFLFYLHGLR